MKMSWKVDLDSVYPIQFLLKVDTIWKICHIIIFVRDFSKDIYSSKILRVHFHDFDLQNQRERSYPISRISTYNRSGLGIGDTIRIFNFIGLSKRSK